MKHGELLLGYPRKVNKVNVLGPRTPRSQKETDEIAEWLVDKFKSPEFRPFFLKTAWRLSRGTIEKHAAAALELGKNPRAYFITLVKRERAYYAQTSNRQPK